jgi:hypothetical protein
VPTKMSLASVPEIVGVSPPQPASGIVGSTSL